MAKLNPNAGVRTGVKGLVRQVSGRQEGGKFDEYDKNGKGLVKFYLEDVTILEGEFEQAVEKFTLVVPVVSRPKTEGLLARSLEKVIGDTDPKKLEGSTVEFGYTYDVFTSKRDGEEVRLENPFVKAVGDSAPDVPPLTKEEILAKLVGLTPAEGVRLAREPGIRNSEYAEILKVKNRVVSELGLEIAEGRYTVP